MNPITRIRQRILLTQFPYTHPLEQRLAVGLQAVCASVLLAWIVWMAGFIFPQNIIGNAPLPTAALVAIFVTPIAAASVWALVNRGSLRQATQIIIALVVVSTLPVDGLNPVSVALLMFTLIASSLLLQPRSFIGIGLVVIISLIAIDLLRADPNTTQLVITALVMTLAAIILVGFSSTLRHMANSTQLQSAQMRVVNRFGQTLQDGPDAARAVSHAINIAMREFGYSFAQAFLADASGDLTTRVRAGLSVVSPSVNTAINLSDTSAIMQAVRQRDVIRITTRDSLLQRGHFVPSSRAGVAIPLLHQQSVIGVLDIQDSSGEHRFDEGQMVVLRLIAGLLAHHLGHITTRNNLEQTVREQENLVTSLRSRSTQVSTPLSKTAPLSMPAASHLPDYFKNRVVGFDLVSDSNQITPASDLPFDIQRALEAGDLVVEDTSDGKILSIPVRLRGDLLGAMSFVLPADTHLSDRQIELARSVSTRMAQALETQQLFEQTQSQAARERRANETASRLLSSTDIRSVMRLAAESFNEALGAINTRVYLDPLHIQSDAPPPQSSEELA